MITFLNIFLFLLAFCILIILVFFSLKIKNKHYHLDILETKIKAIEKRVTKEQTELNELKVRLEEQKIVLNKKWEEIQKDEKIIEKRASKVEEERRLIKEEQSKITSQKIETEQAQLNIQKMVNNFKKNLLQERKEIIEAKYRLTEEQKQVTLAKNTLESKESQMKMEYHKFEKERNYLSARFKELEVTKHDLELLNQKLLEKEQQLKVENKRLIEQKIRIDKEKEKLDDERRKYQEIMLEIRQYEDNKNLIKHKIPELICCKNSKNELKIVFQKPDGVEIAIQHKSSRFRLDGNVIRDDEDIVPLFGGKLPKISDSQLWNDVNLIVIGEEGKADGALRWKFKPETISQHLDLNQVEQQGKTAILSQSKKNWFFIGFYDDRSDLIDSLVFRFIKGLNNVAVAEHPYLPGLTGHQRTTIKFLHERSCTINLINSEKDEAAIDYNKTNTLANIPPDPKWDVTGWEIEDDSGRKTDIKIFMNRIWWSLTNELENVNKDHATDKMLEIPFDKFKAKSHIGINIWLPKRHGIQQISVGFDINDRKDYRVNRQNEKLFIPLSDFLNFDKLQNLSERQPVKLWLDDATNKSIPVAVVLPPLLSCKVKNCDFKTTKQNEMMFHIEDNHVHHFFRELNYEEIRLKYNLNLPLQIYQCGYCNDYVHADNNLKNPTSAIIDHIEQCPKADRRDGSVNIQFRIVKDSNEIRNKEIADLPRVWKCNLCEKFFKGQTKDEMIHHLISVHEMELYLY